VGTHRLVVGVNNIFDKEPPLLGDTLTTSAITTNSNANTAAGFYDTLGRFLFVNLTLGW
jgi:outer membrane receptor protein involved in Fe transport